MPSLAITVVLVILAGLMAYDVYRRYFAPSETLTAQITRKTSAGFMDRKSFNVTIRVPGKTVECAIGRAAWKQVVPGEFARITIAWRHRFIQKVEPMLGLSPEEKLRLQKMLQHDE